VQGRDSGSRATLAGNLRLKLSSRVAIVRHLASSLVLLGLIGTVVGFIISLGGVDPQKAGDVASIAPMVTNLIEDMSVALYTTLVGGVLNIWLSINYNMLCTGTVNLITEITALGARHAGS
jgi:biopolymer transport protein ExbB/TolQ